jgi:hypothetical protein
MSGGLPCDRIDSSIVDDDASTWLVTVTGLVYRAREAGRVGAAVDEGGATPRIRVTILDNSEGVRAVGSTLRARASPNPRRETVVGNVGRCNR